MSSNKEDVVSYFVLIPYLASIGMIILWVFIILSSFFASFGAQEKNVMDRSAVIERLKPIEIVAVKGDEKEAASNEAQKEETIAVTDEKPEMDAAAIDGGAISTATCAACHSIGLLESPKIGDADAWNKSLEANGGMDGLVKSAIAGKGAMPARGGNAGLSDAEVKAAIEFMMQ